jgi:phosphohistidine phosphatase
MLLLALLRHTKSSWKNPALDDPDRPLAGRGKTDAPLMGKAMAARGIAPQLVLCSSARRTRDTLALLLPELKADPQVLYEDRLYHGSPTAMLRSLQKLGGSASPVLLVGHNPELQCFALDLIGFGPKLLRDKLEGKLPTGGLVVISFPAGQWQDVTMGSGELSQFLTPRTAEKA